MWRRISSSRPRSTSDLRASIRSRRPRFEKKDMARSDRLQDSRNRARDAQVLLLSLELLSVISTAGAAVSAGRAHLPRPTR